MAAAQKMQLQRVPPKKKQTNIAMENHHVFHGRYILHSWMCFSIVHVFFADATVVRKIARSFLKPASGPKFNKGWMWGWGGKTPGQSGNVL